jgi:hypothetical protein
VFSGAFVRQLLTGPAAPILREWRTANDGIGRRRRKRASELCHVRRGRACEKVLMHRREEIDHLCVFRKVAFVLDPAGDHPQIHTII